jgi:hypothetical protein
LNQISSLIHPEFIADSSLAATLQRLAMVLTYALSDGRAPVLQ